MITKLTKEEILSNIQNKASWTEHAVVALWKEQTEGERSAQETKERNGRGYNARDAAFMSSLAEQINARRGLSVKQLACARKNLVKYVGQLERMQHSK